MRPANVGWTKLQGVANDLVEHFVSRNNSIGNYWAMGFYRQYLLEHGLRSLRFDLSPEGESAEGDPFQETRQYFSRFIARTIKAKRMAPLHLKCAALTLVPDANDMIIVEAGLQSDRRDSFVSSARVFALPHDSKRESQSGFRVERLERQTVV